MALFTLVAPCDKSYIHPLSLCVRTGEDLSRPFTTLNDKRQRHSYPQGFPGWLSLVPVEEIEDIIGMDAFNKLVVKFREEELGTYKTFSKKIF